MAIKVPFGSTGLDITRVGFGAWAVGGPGSAWGWGAQDDEDSIAAIRHAVELGVSWVDTAPVYGWGHSEDVVRRALEPFSAADRPLVLTKTGPRRAADGDGQMVGDPEHLRAEVHASLRRLGVERLDLLQYHWPADDGTPVEAYWEVLRDLRDDGLVAHIGLSNHDVAQLAAAEAITHVETLQPPLSAIVREAAGDVVPWCREHRTGVIVYSPMQAGLLSGAFTRERADALPDTDWRSRDVEFTDNLDRNLALAAALVPVAQKHAVPVAAVAIAWTLAWPGVSGAIVGGRTPAQVEGWIAAGDLVLDDDDLDAIAAAITATGAGSGPARPPQQ